MTRLSKLTKVAENALSRLDPYFPFYDINNPHDPRQFNAIYPNYEWEVERPQTLNNHRQDWHHVFAVDASTGDRVQIFFERLPGGVAVTWARLKINNRIFTLYEQCSKDLSDASAGVYSAGGVRLECDAPMRFWRVAINAILIEETSSFGHKVTATTTEALEEPDFGKRTENRVNVRFNGRLSVMSHPFEIPSQCSASKIARRYEGIDDSKQAKDAIEQCCSELQAYIQAVTVYSEVELDGDEKMEGLLFGARLRCKGASDFLEGTIFGSNCVFHHIGYGENGVVFHLIESTDERCFGFYFSPSTFNVPIVKGRLRRQRNHTASPFQITFYAGGSSHTIDLSCIDTVAPSRLNSQPGFMGCWFVNECQGELYKQGEIQRVEAITMKLRGKYNIPPEKLSMYSVIEARATEEITDGKSALVVTPTESVCKCRDLTGEKASALASLTAIANYVKQRENTHHEATAEQDRHHQYDFTVPPAVVLTVKAYEEFSSLPLVKVALEDFGRIMKEAIVLNKPEQLNSLTNEFIEMMSKLHLPTTVEDALVSKLSQVFGESWRDSRFAVRCSLVQDDSEESMEVTKKSSFLGVTGSNVFGAVVTRWASQLALTVPHQQRPFDQCTAGPIAVIIQQIVESECAGVIFTCDPITGLPGRIITTANYGLGKSVKYALTDPDSYVIEWRQAETKAQMSILDKTCGTKDLMSVVSSDGTEEVAVDQEMSRSFCLTDEQLLQLASIAIKVTEFSDIPCNIEWAVVKGKMFLLRSRHVRSFSMESDYGIQHDMNSALYTNREILSRGNLDEVSPGSVTPLSLTLVHKILFDFFAREAFEKIYPKILDRTQYTSTRPFTIGKIFFLNFSMSLMTGQEAFINSANVSMFGFDISQHEAIKNGIFHKRKTNVLPMMKNVLKSCGKIEKNVKSATDHLASATIDLPEQADSLTLLMSLLTQIHKFRNGLIYLLNTSHPSSVYTMMAVNVLRKSQREKETTPEIMGLFSKLLRSDSQFEIIQILRELWNLSRKIRDDPRASHFPEMSAEDALKYLEGDEGEVGRQFRILRSNYSHCCHNELDIYSTTWDIDPSHLVRILQENARSTETKKKYESLITLEDLENRPSFVQRRMLNYALPRAKYAMYARETTKSVLMKCVHQIRLATRRIGEQLQTEGRIPHSSLVFFFSVDELFRFITTENTSRLLSKAVRRYRMHDRLGEQIYPVLFNGMPKAIGRENASLTEGSTSLSGTPVSGGVVVGVARVITDFQKEIHSIKRGDILITRTTDIGWTPYFALLGGLVTEVGGLFSHSAVVARDQHVPTVIGVRGAIQLFTSGETVILDAVRGTVTKHRQENDKGDAVPSESKKDQQIQKDDQIVESSVVTNSETTSVARKLSTASQLARVPSETAL